MEAVILVVGLVGMAIVLWPFISSAILFARTRILRERVDALEGELRKLREVLEVRGVREVREVRRVRWVRRVR